MKTYSHFGGAQDWVKYVKKYIENEKVESILELGVGYGTEFLLDNIKKVTSLEIINSSLNSDWFKLCTERYKGYSNWTPICIDATQNMKLANTIAMEQKYPITFDKHIPEYEKLLKDVLDKESFDLIFVDVGIHNRGDLVNILLNENVKIVFAHDSSRDPNRIIKHIYGYNIVKNSNYEEIHFEDTYMGTTFWVRKDLTNIIQFMKG